MPICGLGLGSPLECKENRMAITLKGKVLHGGNLPNITWAGSSWCPVPKRKLHLVTVDVHGGKATLQAAAMRSFLRIVDELKAMDVIIRPISTYRDCKYQAVVCKSICGNPNGCPGMCAPPGQSMHQGGVAVDFHIVKSGGHGYAGAYKLIEKVAKQNGWDNFTGWNPGGSDPNHMTFKRVG